MVVGLALGLAAGVALAAGPDEQLHSEAIALARGGRHDEALKLLGELRARRPEDLRLLQDEILVRVWNGEYATGWLLGRSLATTELSGPMLEALGLAARRSGEFDAALARYREAALRDPTRENPALGVALTLTDAGRLAEAGQTFADLARRYPESSRRRLAEAYFHARRGQHLRALELYLAVLGRLPQSEESATGVARSLQALGAPRQAALRVPRRESLLRRELDADQAAQRLRWGEGQPAAGESPRADTDRGLIILERLGGLPCVDLDLSGALEQRLCLDAMVGLRDAGRAVEVLDIARRLAAAGVNLPAYARMAEADALLATREPGRAAGVYRGVLAELPDHPTARASLFYALIDAEDFAGAFSLIDAALLTATPTSTPSSLDLETLAALGALYADHLDAAESRLQDLARAHPEKAGLLAPLAATARARGHPREAEAHYRALAAAAPDNQAAAQGLAGTRIDRGDLDSAASDIRALHTTDPAAPGFARLARGWYASQQTELYIDTRLSSSEGVQIGSSDRQFDVWLFAPPIRHQHRPYLRSRLLSAELPEGTPTDIRIGAGLESTWRDWRTRVEVAEGLADVNDPSISLNTRYRPTDHWEFESTLEANTLDLPLRAAASEDTAGVVGAAAVYRWHERQRAQVGLRYMGFSDSNDRIGWQAAFERGFWLTPRASLSLRSDVAGSHNSATGRPYFNPRDDLGWTVTLDHRLRLWRHYERSLTQRIRASAGLYNQSGFATDEVWSLAYQQEFRMSPELELIYGLARSRKLFDGAPEDVVTLYATIDARL